MRKTGFILWIYKLPKRLDMNHAEDVIPIE